MSRVLECIGLSKCYQDGEATVEVLDSLDLTLDAGRSLAITGPSGSGKSTLLNIIAGVIEADSGQLQLNLNGECFHPESMSTNELTRMRRQYIGYVYQFFNLVPTLTVLENVRLPAHLNKRADLDDRAIELLCAFGLGERMHNFPETLSGGEQQRTAVARALLMSPPLILADEPTGNLDAANAQQVASLLFEYAQSLNVSVIVATHSDAVAARADDHLHLGG